MSAGLKRARSLLQDASVREAIKDEATVRSLPLYFRRIWNDLGTGTRLVAGWYLDAILDHLQGVGNFLLGKPGGIQRLAIAGPARSIKSTATGVGLPTWMWLWDPTLKTLSASYDQILSVRDTRLAREVMQGETYLRLLEHQRQQRGIAWTWTSDQNVKSYYSNTAGGNRLATQVGGGTGKGGRLIILDDPLSIDGSKSEQVTAATIEWIFSTIWTRQDEPQSTAMVICAHRTREDDPTGEAMKRNLGFELLELPLEYDPAYRRPKTSIGWEDPRTEKGASLEDRRWPAPIIEELKETLQEDYPALALQRPENSQHKPIQKTMISRWRDLPAFERLVQTWDTAFKGEDPTLKKEKQVRSMTAGQLWGVTGGRIYLLDARAEYADPARQLEMIREMHADWPATSYTLVEDEANGSAIMSLLQNEIRCIGIIPDKSKYLRLIAVRKFIAAGIALFAPEGSSPGLDLVVKQLLAFPSAPNDHVDATSQILRFELLPDPTTLPQGPGQMSLESRLRAMVG